MLAESLFQHGFPLLLAFAAERQEQAALALLRADEDEVGRWIAAGASQLNQGRQWRQGRK
jgi:hypothetical protein